MIASWFLNHDDELRDAIKDLQELGLAYRDRSCCYVQPLAMSLAAITPREQHRLERIDRVITTTERWLRWYGAAPLKEMNSCLGRMIKTEEDASAQAEYWRIRFGMDGVHLVNSNEVWLTHPLVGNAGKLIAAQLSDPVKRLPYYKPPKELWERCLNVPGQADACHPIEVMLTRSGLDEDEIDDLLIRIYVLIQNDEDQAAVELLADNLVDSPSPAQMKTISGFFEQIPMWKLKGYSIAGLNSGRKAPMEKAQQGSLCPCGSGRLYRSCCGRLN